VRGYTRAAEGRTVRCLMIDISEKVPFEKDEDVAWSSRLDVGAQLELNFTWCSSPGLVWSERGVFACLSIARVGYDWRG
jgi:hypothetical protein